MQRLTKIPRTVCGLIEPAVQSVANRLYILTGGRQGSKKHRPSIEKYFETGLVTALYEYLLMSPTLSHLEIRHENPYGKKTRPEQIDLWIRHPPPSAGPATAIECGDFTPGKLKHDASKLRRLNGNGTNWFLAFFREQPTPNKPDPPSVDPYKALSQCRKRKGSLKGVRVTIDKRMTKSFRISLPDQADIIFGFSLIRVK